MAEQGADVIKVELPDGVGDRMRSFGTRRGGMSAAFQGSQPGQAVDRARFQERARGPMRCGACAPEPMSSSRTSAPGRPSGSACPNPISGRSTPTSSTSRCPASAPPAPDPTEKVYDYVIQAMTGMASLQADETGHPQLTRHVVVDKLTALTVSQAITAALFRRERGRGGQHVEISHARRRTVVLLAGRDDGPFAAGRRHPPRSPLRPDRPDPPDQRRLRLPGHRRWPDLGRALRRVPPRVARRPPLRHARRARAACGRVR